MSAKPKTTLDKAKEQLYFEQQDGRLCGVHALNNALQMKVFDAVSLAKIAQQLDEEERKRMAEYGTHTQEYMDFVSKPSSNYDDSGYFSIEVLAAALKTFDLELVNWRSDDPRAEIARQDPTTATLFVCHMEDHWFAIRKFGNKQWINLNSLKTGPELLTDTYLSIFMQTLQGEGYIIFVVCGDGLPESEADRAFEKLRKDENGKYIDESVDVGHRLGSSVPETDEEMLRRGLELSLAKNPAEAVRKQREQFLKRFESCTKSQNNSAPNETPPPGNC